MNHCIAGKPGDGKGLLSTRLLIHDLAKSDRIVITNLCVEKRPWVTGDHKPRRGMLDYLRDKYRGRTLDAEERVFRLQHKAMQNFFLYRGLSSAQVEKLGDKHLQGYRLVTREDEVLDESEWNFHNEIKLYVADHKIVINPKNGRASVTEYDTRLSFASGGHWVNVDEAWSLWPARGWSNTSDGVLYYCSMVRRFGDDCYFQSQRVNDVDSILMERCQDFMVCKNHGRLRFGIFRQLPVFVVSVYDHRPTPSSEPSFRKPFQLDVKGLAECYDTSGGVGVSGKVLADIGRKQSGLPLWLVPAVGVCCIIALIFAVKWGMGKVKDIITGKKHPAIVQHAVNALDVSQAKPSDTNSVPTVEKPADSPAVFRKNRLHTNDEPEITCTGYVVLLGKPKAFLSDGTIAEPPELSLITKKAVTVDGKEYRILPIVNHPENYIPQPVPEFSLPVSTAFHPVNQAIILPSIHAVGAAPPPRLNGFGNMQKMSSAGREVMQNAYGQNP